MAGKFKILFVLCLVASCTASTFSFDESQFEIKAGGDVSNETTPASNTTSATSTASNTTATTTTAPSITSATSTASNTTATTTTAPSITSATTTASSTTSATTTAPSITSATSTAPSTTATTTTTEAGVTTTAETTTTKAGGTGDTTTQPSGGTTTVGAGDTTTQPSGGTTTTTTTTEASDACISSPCLSGSTCEPRNDKAFVCLCLPGDTYNYTTNICKEAKVFPGELSLTKLTYNDKMSDKKSPEFKVAADGIVAEVDKTFKPNEGFSGATVLELQPLSTRAKGVKATVEITFQADATIDESTVKDQMNSAAECTGCPLEGATFTTKSLCESKPCDLGSTTCMSADGNYSCNCKDGYIETNLTSRVCIAACLIGEEAKDGECIKCSYGYSGFNCEDSWKLVLTIVGSILGGLLLVTLILLPVVALKLPKKGPKKSKEADIGMSQVNQPNTKAPMTSNFSNGYREPANGIANSAANTGMQRFPRAATNNNWESRTNLDMTPSNSRQNLIPASRTSRYDDDDDAAPYAQVRPQSSLYSQARPQSNLYAQTRPQSNPYAQTQPQSSLYAQTKPQSNPYALPRPQSNPYAQTRPQSNPYASSQGQSTSYFSEDVGRRY